MATGSDEENGIVLLDATEDSLTISWPAVKGATTYHLQYCPVEENGDDDDDEDKGSSTRHQHHRFFTTLSSSMTATQARKKNLTAGTRYEFRVAASSSDKDSEEWTTHATAFSVLASGMEEQRLAPPSAVPSGNFAALVQWKAQSCASLYELQMREAVGGAPWTTVAASLTSTEARKKNLRSVHGYHFRVRPVSPESPVPFSSPSPVVVAFGLAASLRNLFSSLEPPQLLLKAASGAGDKVPLDDALGGKEFVALYVSAHWCGPCRHFTPQLMQFYHREAHAHVQVVFVSADHDERGFQSYFGTMPWLAVPFDDEEARQDIMGLLRVSGIPRLVVYDGRTGRVLQENAVASPLQLNVWRQWRNGAK